MMVLPLGSRAARVVAALLLACLWPAGASAQQVRLNKLADVAFGTLANLGVDAVRNQNVCIYSTTATKGYNIRATGPAGGPFTMTSGARTMAYEVAWNQATGQTTGTALTAGVTQTGFRSTAANSGCTSAPLTTASLIVTLRGTTLSSATAGAYTGVLTLIVAPE